MEAAAAAAAVAAAAAAAAAAAVAAAAAAAAAAAEGIDPAVRPELRRRAASLAVGIPEVCGSAGQGQVR